MGLFYYNAFMETVAIKNVKKKNLTIILVYYLTQDRCYCVPSDTQQLNEM